MFFFPARLSSILKVEYSGNNVSQFFSTILIALSIVPIIYYDSAIKTATAYLLCPNYLCKAHDTSLTWFSSPQYIQGTCDLLTQFPFPSPNRSPPPHFSSMTTSSGIAQYKREQFCTYNFNFTCLK